MREELFIGEIVTGIYKTGKYIGEITNIRPEHYLVKVKAVIKHPLQGDLHMPKESEVPLFHERRALAEKEQTNIPKSMVRKYEGIIPAYQESLRKAVAELENDLAEDSRPWAKMSLEKIQVLKADYFK
ncbi:kinase-associated lipoprotein B [Metabacillus idriensis]|uniref:Kinase n=1 Tax=Metabacillus idriensis TaxID=324768 RepID=A0A6I2MG44_9BACI|nr:kinase-associated lipoprotein B [Metabacillus idriensis]MCM3597778.1 kinase-associated lipoprotein B [Metabacillus idriensis]MRX54773.1 kinase [Metabacillus idriensis]OHR68975.1 kinase [Bacillus sp. HMSC76G11]